ncbi:peptidase A24 [Methanosarcina sp. 2.H.T.1A.6]|uniref:A24 family peptidase C-terminal domain-containing protein n=1 Tax=unclassified Methanosarcina TaxID=2644672 RepID=UPI00062242D8|nr:MULTISPECIES: A24 family peptidase C-terminal domain-containing protein [unclassified Methanosarcina]KKG14529.1 peptidase A24 [Methanosarcina sp. 2.H.T.1A.3]KKG23286.1 peptidase A24 [Methanosarcina sp. 2.H.T.1A.15]KKG24219.1 peptidase A24 [Methanosarcina sp. 2.H.T.1A.8]KKG24968.1 peptidase A24 [Methanosarcina sp. 2.H.T.1A.6]
MIEVLKLAACLPFLLYSSYLDLKTRRVPNRVWKLMLLSLSGFLIYEIVNGGIFFLLQLVFSFYSSFFLVYLLFRIRIFGGADAKALIVIGTLVPVYPAPECYGYTFPLLGFPPAGLFALTVLENSFLLTAAVPLGLFCYNILHFTPDMLKKPYYMLFAYRTNIKDLRRLLEKGRHIRLAERFELNNGKLYPFFAGRGITVNHNMLSRLEAHEEQGLLGSTIWVTPGLPFMIPITVSFVLAVIFGDLVFYFLTEVLSRFYFFIGK